DRMNKARVHDIDEAHKQGLINEGEAAQLKKAAKAVAAAIAVDDFAADELTHHDANHEQGDGPSPAQKRSRPAAAE
ncbi:MAG: acyl-CoA dehydrogenase domain-containing protein, partial [Terriglobia bacterium]